jgi:hypothetical protein
MIYEHKNTRPVQPTQDHNIFFATSAGCLMNVHYAMPHKARALKINSSYGEKKTPMLP